MAGKTCWMDKSPQTSFAGLAPVTSESSTVISVSKVKWLASNYARDSEVDREKQNVLNGSDKCPVLGPFHSQ